MNDSRHSNHRIDGISSKYTKAGLIAIASALLQFSDCRPANSGDAFRTICYIGRSANLSGSSGKNEIAVAIMKKTGYSKRLSEKIAQKIIDDNCPGIW